LIKHIDHMVQEGFLKERNLSALHIETNPEELVSWLMHYEPEKMEKKWIYRGKKEV